MTAVKDDLIKAVRDALVAQDKVQNLPSTKVACEAYIDAVINGVLSVTREHSLLRTSIGTFRWVQAEACVRRNPRTGEPVDVPAMATLKFSASKNIRSVEGEKKEEKKVAAKPAVKKETVSTVKRTPPVVKAVVGKRK